MAPYMPSVTDGRSIDRVAQTIAGLALAHPIARGGKTPTSLYPPSQTTLMSAASLRSVSKIKDWLGNHMRALGSK